MRTDDSARGGPRNDRANLDVVSHDGRAAENQILDDWLDAALADTFPASDPIASPPEAQPISRVPDSH